MSQAIRTLSMLSLAMAALGCVPGESEDSAQRRCQEYSKRVAECYDQRCAQIDAPQPFCTCWCNGMDLSGTCQCIARDLNAVCVAANLDAIDPSQFNCAAAMDVLKNFCAKESVNLPTSSATTCNPNGAGGLPGTTSVQPSGGAGGAGGAG